MFGQTGSGKTYTMTSLFSLALDRIFTDISGTKIFISVYEILGKNVINLLQRHPDDEHASSSPSPRKKGGKTLERKDSEPKWFTDGASQLAGASVNEQEDSFSSSDNSCPPFAAAGADEADEEGKSEKENDPTYLKYFEDEQGMIHIKDLPNVEVTTAEDAMQVLKAAQSRRATAITGVHDQSSRSHAFVRITTADSDAQLLLIDLAGSERSKDSLFHNSERLRETSEINKSLAALKACIQARSRGESYVPYRQNLLTRLLKASLVDAHTVVNVIATASPSSSDTEHTLSTVNSVTEMLATSPEDSHAADHIPTNGPPQGKRFKLATIEVPTMRQRRAQDDYRKAASANPKKWTKEQVDKWFKKAAPGVEPPNVTGTLLVRWPKSRFVQHVRNNSSNGSDSGVRRNASPASKFSAQTDTAKIKSSLSPEGIHSPERVGSELYYNLRKELAKVGTTLRKKALATRGSSP